MNPYQGLKHFFRGEELINNPGSNQHESLSGIETLSTDAFDFSKYYVPINMNPYQGLKQKKCASP